MTLCLVNLYLKHLDQYSALFLVLSRCNIIRWIVVGSKQSYHVSYSMPPGNVILYFTGSQQFIITQVQRLGIQHSLG